jgi:hypothetical protein
VGVNADVIREIFRVWRDIFERFILEKYLKGLDWTDLTSEVKKEMDELELRGFCDRRKSGRFAGGMDNNEERGRSRISYHISHGELTC